MTDNDGKIVIEVDFDTSSAVKGIEELEKQTENSIGLAEKLAEGLKALSGAMIGLGDGISSNAGNISTMGKEVAEAVKIYAKEAYDTQILLLDNSIKAFRDAENEKLSILSGANDERAANELRALSDNNIEQFIATQLGKINEELSNALIAAPQAAADMLATGKSGIEEAFILLDEYNPLWQEKGAAFMEYFNKGATEGGEDFITGMSRIATDAMEGMLQAIKDARPGITAELDDLARAILAALQTSTGVESPSKKTYAIGEFVGEGLILGTVDKVKAMLPDISAWAAAVPAAMNAAAGNISSNDQIFNNTSSVINNHYDTQLPIHFENVDMRGQSDIVAVSENLAFLARQAIAGKGGV